MKQPDCLKEKESTAVFGSKHHKIHNDKLWWREMEQNVQREPIAKSFKKPEKIILKFILTLIVHNPQYEIFAILIHAVARNPYRILKKSCSGNNFSIQFGVSKHK